MKSFALAQEAVNDTNSAVDILGESNVNRSYAYIRLPLSRFIIRQI